jgi:hypothetical protein
VWQSNRSLVRSGRLVWIVFWGVVAGVTALGSLTFLRREHVAAGRQLTPAASCRANPLANVYSPRRLRILDGCTTVSGVVDYVQHQDDGDFHIVLRVDPGFGRLLNFKNVLGELVLEIVPADQPGCIPGEPPPTPSDGANVGTCTGANLSPPEVGRHIAATGPHVLDAEHGWMEIHPVWGWTYLDDSKSRLPIAFLARHFLPNE